MSDRPFRLLPQLTPENEHFWTGGAENELRLLRCTACGTWIHPAQPLCPACLSRDLEVAVASGLGRVATFTINHHPWIPGFDPPYVIAIVELEEQRGLRLMTNLVGVAPDDVRIDLPVRVVFEPCEDGIHLPLFEPAP